MNSSTIGFALFAINIIWFVCSCIQNKGWHDHCVEVSAEWFVHVRRMERELQDLEEAIDNLKARVTELEDTIPIDVEEI